MKPRTTFKRLGAKEQEWTLEKRLTTRQRQKGPGVIVNIHRCRKLKSLMIWHKIELRIECIGIHRCVRSHTHTHSHTYNFGAPMCAHKHKHCVHCTKGKMEAVNRAEDASYLHIDLLAFRLYTSAEMRTLLMLLLLLSLPALLPRCCHFIRMFLELRILLVVDLVV